jgi:hypothetical protein
MPRLVSVAVLAALQVASAAKRARAVAQPTWCQQAPQSGWPVCDTNAPIDARSADIVSRLSIDDKIAALGTTTPALTSIGLPAYNWWSEATHGLYPAYLSCCSYSVSLSLKPLRL